MLDKIPVLQGPYGIGVLIALVVIAVLIYNQVKKKEYKDIELQIPATRRSDLVYGYYSAIERTFDQVSDHVNLFWFSHFSSIEQLISIMKNTNVKIVVDLAPYLYEGSGKRKGVFRGDAAMADLRAFFHRLRDAGVLHKVTYLYPKDEPNLFMASAEEHLKGIHVVKALRAEFEELRNARLAVIYAGGGDWMNIEHFDVVAVDNYDQKSELLTIGDHADLVKNLSHNQKTFLIPGPSFGHLPDPWVAYALLNPNQVEGVIPFIWFDHPDHKDTSYTGLEAQPQEFRDKWIRAANICLNRA